jgi:NDP-sugar pyrophosphorylase family protein
LDAIGQAVVLAGGRGTRLGGLTQSTPKPLLPVGGRPFIEWVLMNLARHNVKRVILAVGYRSEAFEKWQEGYDGAVEVTMFFEDEPLDTGGALTLMVGLLDDALFVLNGDTLFDVPFGELGLMLDHPSVGAAMALRSVPDAGRYGCVTIQEEKVTGFDEKRHGGPGLINGGVYALRRNVLTDRSAPLSIEIDLFPELVREDRLVGLPCAGFFTDIGVPESLREAQDSVPEWWASVGET